MLDLLSSDVYIINFGSLILAIFIILLLSFLDKRQHRQDVCQGRPALIVPFHFLDGYENRAVYAVAFGTTISTVVSLITSAHTDVVNLPLWAEAFYVYLQAIVGCVSCYPLFACLTTRHKALGAFLCIVYSLLWLILNVVQVAQAVDKVANQNTSESQNSVIVNVNNGYQVLNSLPIILCYLVLIIHCCYTLCKCFVSKIYTNHRTESPINLHQEEHVRWILRKYRIKFQSPDTKSSGPIKPFLDQMKNSVKMKHFTNFPFFKYPTRMVALSFVQLNILYWAGLFLMVLFIQVTYTITHLQVMFDFLTVFEDDIAVIFSVSLGCAIFVCILNGLTQIFIGIRNYRYDILRIYQGDKIFAPVSSMSPQNILTRSMMFPGYQVAFMLWGILMCFATVFLLTAVSALILYFTAKLDMLGALVISLAQLLSFPATVLVMFYLLVFLTKKVLLQGKVKVTDKDPPLNVDNRNLYEIISYYSLFTNMAVGLFTCLLRILQSAFFGIFAIARLDRSVFPRDLESWDRGYTAYISMLLVDNAHNNPCMRVFVHLLWTKIESDRLENVEHEESVDAAPLISRSTSYQTRVEVDDNTTDINSFSNFNTFSLNKERVTSTQTCSRWHLAYTLINNPQLRRLRKQKLKKDKITVL